MTKRTLGSVLLAGAMAVTLMSAPVSNARPTCVDSGASRRCETHGSVSIKAVPQKRAGNVGVLQRRGVWDRN